MDMSEALVPAGQVLDNPAYEVGAQALDDPGYDVASHTLDNPAYEVAAVIDLVGQAQEAPGSPV